MNKWQSIWNDRRFPDEIQDGTTEDTFFALKRLMGINTAGEIGGADFIRQFEKNLVKMGMDSKNEPNSFFEVGCGSGANLYYLGKKHEKTILGGMDYSEPLANAARKALSAASIMARVQELYVDEARNIDTSIKYDCVFARSVFQYFPNEQYGIDVAGKMMEKANGCVGIFDLFDLHKKEDLLSYRRSVIENYDEKYKDTPLQFYSKESFLNLADEHHCDVLFTRDPLKGYHNETFSFDVYMYKRNMEK